MLQMPKVDVLVPKTLNPEPGTRNPKPEIRNPKQRRCRACGQPRCSWCSSFSSLPSSASSFSRGYLPTPDFTRSNCKKRSRTWSTSQVFHVLESPLSPTRAGFSPLGGGRHPAASTIPSSIIRARAEEGGLEEEVPLKPGTTEPLCLLLFNYYGAVEID